MKSNNDSQGQQGAAGLPSDDGSLTPLHRTLLNFYAGSDPEFLDQIRNLKLKSSPARKIEQLPPRVQAIVNRAMDGLTGDTVADLLRVRYSLMLVYGESDFSDDAHNRRALMWEQGIMPAPDGGKL